MSAVRRAGVDDAAELTRLREVMFTDMGRDRALLDERWRERNIAHFTERLRAVDAFAAFVVDRPGGLAAAAIGWLDQHLVGVRNPNGQVGYIANMATDREYRRRGFGRLTLTALLDWFETTGVATVNLHASADGEQLYRSVGFTEPQEPSLTLRLRDRRQGPRPVPDRPPNGTGGPEE